VPLLPINRTISQWVTNNYSNDMLKTFKMIFVPLPPLLKKQINLTIN